MSKILVYIPTFGSGKAGLCEFCLKTALEKYSKHDIDFSSMYNIDKFDIESYDIVHIHNHINDKFWSIKKPKLIYDIHNFILNCPMGGFNCLILNKFLQEPLTCLSCLGEIGIRTGSNNLEKCIKFAQKANIIAVHSEFLKEFYHMYNPFLLNLPLEVDELKYTSQKEDYLLYSARMSFEKNPYGFIRVIEKTKLRGKMLLYDLTLDPVMTKHQYRNILLNKNVEVILNPSKKEMIDLVSHAKFTVLPYFFAEPFGIAAVNSVLCGTPLITFPYGNLRNMTTLLPKTLDEMVQMIKMDNKQYSNALKETKERGDELRIIHNPINAVKKWDKTYENL